VNASPRTAPAISAALAALVACVLAPGRARADTDYDPSSDAWNGLSQLVAAGRDIGVRVETPTRLDVGTLAPDDGLLIVYPTGPLPVDAIGGFLKAGGRVALADDYGTGAALLTTYQIARRPPDPGVGLRLRGNDALLVARPEGAHPLGEGVGALVTNHPEEVRHRDLEPIFAFDGGGGALVLAGAVGAGRLVTLGDPSVLINNMQQFRGNRRFATNLIRYLAEGRSGRLVVVTGRTPVVGRFGEVGADRPLHDLRRALEQAARVTLPPPALRLAAATLCAVLIVFAASALPRRSPYDGEGMFARTPHVGGFEGRIAHFREGTRDLTMPALVYKAELEAEIVRRLGLSGLAVLRDVLGGLRARGATEAQVEQARELLVDLDALDRRYERSVPTHVTPARFGDMVRRGEQVLALLPDRTPTAR
jgi:hypothetical protein